MKKHLFRAVIALALFVIIYPAVRYFNRPQQAPLKPAIELAIARPADTMIDLAATVPFDWDELFIFTPYSSGEEACALLNLGWLDCRINISGEAGSILGSSYIPEGGDLLVFRRAGNIVHTELAGRNFGTDQQAPPRPVRRDDARFAILRTQDGSASLRHVSGR